MDRNAGKRAPRSFVYVSDSKLAAALAQADARSVRGMLPRVQTLGVNLGPFNVTFGVPSPDLADRDYAKAAARVATAEQHIRASYQAGDLAVGEQWVSGRVDMEWAPMGNGQTVLFCGYAGPLLVVLGGSLGNVYGSASSADRTGSYSHTIRTVVLNGDNPADLGHDLETITRTICHRPQSVRFLARVIERGKLPEGSAQREFLLATPLYVEYAYRPDESDSAAEGTLRWLNWERGWGIIVPDHETDGVVVTASALTEGVGVTITPGQRVTFRVTHGSAGIEATSVRLASSRPGNPDAQPPEIMVGEPLGQADPIRIDRYEVLRRLGEGSMGVVYLARGSDRSLVAIKIIRPDYARDPVFLGRFRGEFDNARSVCAPNVARVLTCAVDGDRPFLVAEFIDGLTLEDHVERHGPLPLPQAMRLAEGSAAGLAAIHAAGIAHRDLAPSNIILSASGPKIIDFGLARPLENYQGFTHIGVPVGTLRYASPEQIEQGRLTQASDIFCWGGVTVFAATGHLPFGSPEAPLAQVLDAIRREDPNLDGLPVELRQLVAAALHKDPEQRPTALQIVAILTGGAATGTAGGDRETIPLAGHASASRSEAVNASRELIAAVSVAASDRLPQLTLRPGAAEPQSPVAQPTEAASAQGDPEAIVPGIQPSGHVPGDRLGQPSAPALRLPERASRRHGQRHLRGILFGAMAVVAVIAMAAVISQKLAKSNPPRPRATTTPRTQAAPTPGTLQAGVTAIGIVQDQSAPGNNGCIVTSIAPNSPVSNAGLRPGDTITNLNDVTLTSCGDLPMAAFFTYQVGSITYTDTSGVSHETELNSSSSPPSSSSSANL